MGIEGNMGDDSGMAGCEVELPKGYTNGLVLKGN